MDPQELLSLLGVEQGPVTTPGEADFAQLAEFYNPASPAPTEQAPRPVSTEENPYPQAVTDFEPQTTTFENDRGPVTYLYDNQGNLIPQSSKVSVSTQGYSPEKARQIEAGPMGSGALGKTRAKVNSQIRGQYAPLLQEQDAANQEQLDAAQQASIAESQIIEAKGRAQQKVMGHYQEAESALRAIAESGAVASRQAMNEYRMRLISIPEVNPNALWDEAGQEGQFQMAAAAFVHNMLGAKGINTTAMDTINNAINNKIKAQIANIERGKAVAAGFKDLYDMTVQESASKMEVEAKLRGYMLKAMEAGIDSELAPYDSQLARAKHAAAKAAFRQAHIKNDLDVEKHIQNSVNEVMQQETSAYNARLQASIARERIEADKEIERMRLDASKNKVATSITIPDLTTSGGGKMRWKIKPTFAGNKDIVEGVTQKIIHTTVAAEALDKLMKIQDEIDGGAAPDKLGRLRSERDRYEQAARNSIVWALTVDVAGKRATDKDYERIAAMVPAKDWFTNGNNRRIIARLIGEKLKETNFTIKTYADDLTPNDPEFNQPSAQQVFGEAEGIQAALIENKQDTHTETEVEAALKKVNGPDAVKHMTEGDGDEFQAFTKPYWEDFRKTAEVSQSEGVLKGLNLPPKAFDGVRELAELAYSGDSRAEQELYVLSNSNAKVWQKKEYLAKEAATYFINKIEEAKARDSDKTAVDPITGVPAGSLPFGHR